MLERSGIVKNYFPLSTEKMRYPFPHPQRSFYPRPKRLAERKAVTIAAGFQYLDGVILATDLEITESVLKRVGGKSMYYAIRGNTVAIAGAGNYDLLV